MKHDNDPRFRELTPAEIEALRQEMREAIEWAQAELVRRRDDELGRKDSLILR